MPKLRLYTAPSVVVVDDVGLLPMARDAAGIFFHVVNTRYEGRPHHRHDQEGPAGEWLGQLSDALLAESAIDRLKSAAYELVLEGESHRSHEKPGLPVGTTTPRPHSRRCY